VAVAIHRVLLLTEGGNLARVHFYWRGRVFRARWSSRITLNSA
jgi:hypothetical protein